MDCFKDMPCNLKFAYALIALLFVLTIFNLSKVEKATVPSVSDEAIKVWIDKNPEAILESVNKYVAQQQEEMIREQREQAAANIKNFDKELKDTKYAGVLNPKGTVEIVEFYDYNCGYCKMVAKNIEKLLETRKDAKVILRNIPILGQASRYAAEVGMAILIDSPAKYPEFHKILMNGSARSKEEVNKAVESAGLKFSKIEEVLKKNKKEIDAAIQSNMDLASKIGINGTPAFIINGELIPGAVDTQTLESLLK